MTIGLLTLTVICNAAQLGMHANDLAPPWWVAAAVGAVPPAVVGATVHLIVLVSRHRKGADPAPPQRTAVDTSTRERAEQLIAAGAGRPRVAAELGLTDHQARRLVLEIRQTSTPARPRPDHRSDRREPRDRHPGDETDPYPSAERCGPEPPADDQQG